MKKKGTSSLKGDRTPKTSNYRHRELAAGRWNELSFLEQMAHVGSEVERALKWREKKNEAYGQKAFERAIELMDLTIACPRNLSRLKEINRVKEVWADFFVGSNEFASTAQNWRKYFMDFARAVRR